MTSSRLEFDFALDLAASWLGGFDGECLGLASNEQFARDLAVRGCAPTRIARSAAEVAGAEEAFDSVVWAAPQRNTWEGLGAHVSRALRPGGRLCVLTATSLGGLVGPLRRARAAGEPAPLAGSLARRLPGLGFQFVRTRPLGGGAAVGWALAGRAALLVGRPDLADRAERAHHVSVESHVAASFVVYMAEKVGRE